MGLTGMSLGLSGCGQELDAFAEDEAADSAPPPIILREQGLPATYYENTIGKSGIPLLQALAEIVYTGHRPLSYSGARNQLFAQVEDWDNDDVVGCVYTGRLAAPVNSTLSANNASMNTEHSWPQSLGATGAAQADLHHLFASDVAANGRRGNLPFGEVKTVTWTAPNPDGAFASRLGSDGVGHTVFEPHPRTKGAIARAIFYFYTRYASRQPSKFTLSNFNIEETTLRRWHKSYPPDAEERARNELVYAIQGNRNPYIDHPEFVDAISDFP